jgi:hypothetical protein
MFQSISTICPLVLATPRSSLAMTPYCHIFLPFAAETFHSHFASGLIRFFLPFAIE